MFNIDSSSSSVTSSSDQDDNEDAEESVSGDDVIDMESGNDNDREPQHRYDSFNNLISERGLFKNYH